MESGRIAVIPIDICGALTLKNLYRSRAVLVFTEREKRAILMNILNRPIPDSDKVQRLLSLDFELRNIELCDFAVQFDSGLQNCVKEIYRELQIDEGGAELV